ncbi:MAG: ATP-binding protein, partial [Acidobacteria bacterium]|nr:ATP-binding protein [Acidobacteriota bacterium]
MSSMREQRSVNPFVPGRGVLPPCLAGRDAEQRELMRLLAYLQAGRGAPRDAVVSGPRGNGKTVLLRWLQGEIEADGEIDVVWRTPSDLPALDALATALAP